MTKISYRINTFVSAIKLLEMFRNRFKIYFLFFLLLEAVKLHASEPFVNLQQAVVAEKNLLYQKENPEKAKTFLNLSSWYYYNKTPKTADQKALYFAYKALSLSKKIQYDEGIAESYFKLSVILQKATDYKKAKICAGQAVKRYTALNLQNELGEAWVMYWSTSFLTGTSYKNRIPLLDNAAVAFYKSGNKEREADCYKENADVYLLLGNAPKAIMLLNKSLSLYRKSLNGRRLNDKIYGIYDLLGSSYLFMGDYKTAIQYGLKAAQIGEKLDKISLYLCTVYNRIGLAYAEFQDYKNAQKYYFKSLTLAEWHNNDQAITELTYNYTDVLLKQHQTAHALSFLNSMRKKHPKLYTIQSAPLQCRYAEIYMRMKRYRQALSYIKPIKAKIKDLEEYNDIMEAYKTVVKLSIVQKKYPEAALYSFSYDSMAKKLNNKQFFATSKFLKYSIDSAQGNTVSAMNNYREYVEYSKHLYDENKTKQINQLNILYETEKRNKNIIQLKNNSTIQKNKLRNASAFNNLMIVITISLLIIVMLLYRVYRLKQRTNKILSEQQDEINIKNKKLENLLTEKEWLLKEIHHRVKNNLHMVVGLLASQAEFLKNKEAVQAINDSQNRIQTMSLIHQKLYQSENLSMINMPSYIFELTEYLKDSFDIGKSIRFIVDIDNFDLPLSHSIPIGLIFNEAVTNSIKYAFPNNNPEGKIIISLKAEKEHTITLIIHDNGIGLPPEFDPCDSPSLGINLMKGLSEDIKGTFKIISDNGTKISLEFHFDETNNFLELWEKH
ncbi:MAG: tetratricopeptide repeat protein [Flavobacterium sp.]|nr:MAG: tetratricopeptide repeat protein [Flavobacterium sp.]